MNETPFKVGLKNQIRKAIRLCKESGTVGISVKNLLQIVRPPASGLAGAPVGTNAQYYYAQQFREVCVADAKIAAFITDFSL